MKEIIKIINKKKFLLSTELLGLSEAQLWIGVSPDGPIDNDDERVRLEREREEREKGLPGKRISGIEAVDLIESVEFPGWFEVDVTDWKDGKYRINVHSKANIQAPNGTELRDIRDGQYSWPSISDEDLIRLSKEQKDALYLENNKAGFCIRISVNKAGLSFAGNGNEWVERWKDIKKEIESHYKEKMKKK